MFESTHNFKILASNIKRIEEGFSINVITELFIDTQTDEWLQQITFETALIYTESLWRVAAKSSQCPQRIIQEKINKDLASFESSCHFIWKTGVISNHSRWTIKAYEESNKKENNQ